MMSRGVRERRESQWVKKKSRKKIKIITCMMTSPGLSLDSSSFILFICLFPPSKYSCKLVMGPLGQLMTEIVLPDWVSLLQGVTNPSFACSALIASSREKRSRVG